METTTSPYPLQLTGELSSRLSRGLWLVKWPLAILHDEGKRPRQVSVRGGRRFGPRWRG